MNTLKAINLVAPNCAPDQIICCKVGLRPMHELGPQLSCEVIQDNNTIFILAHNYGHGGCGWTFAPGSALMCYATIIKAQAQLKDSVGQSVAVLGAGINGLMTAYILTQRGFNVTIYAQEFSPNTTSDVAAAIFSPPSITKSFDEQLLKKLLCDSYKYYEALADSAEPELPGITRRDFYTYQDDAGMETAVKYGLIPAGERVAITFAKSSAVKQCVKYPTFVMDPDVIMPALMRQLKAAGVTFKQQYIENKRHMLQLGHRIIVNCLGRGSRAAYNDTHMTPVQGQVVYLKPQQGVDYVFAATNNDGSYTHWIPKQNCLFVGGTFTRGIETIEPEQDVCDAILARVKSITE